MSEFRETLDELFVSKLGFEFKGEPIPKPDIPGRENVIQISREYSARDIDVILVICKDRIIEFQKRTIKFYKALHPDSHFLFISNNGKVYDLYNVSTSKKLKHITYDEIAKNTKLFKERIQFFNVEASEGTVDLKVNIEKSFDYNDKITKDFYKEFSIFHKKLQGAISGIDSEDDKQWYTSVLMNRIMFIYFLQKHGVIQSNTRYLLDMFELVRKNKDDYFKNFLLPLFFYGFAKRDNDPDKIEFMDKYGHVRYLNGGLFYEHSIERKYRLENIEIIDGVKVDKFDGVKTKISVNPKTLGEILKFLDGYAWYLDSREYKDEKYVNPDVLGYIFEQYVNDRSGLGVYYTKEDITGYITKNTIIPFIFDKLREKGFEAPDPNPMITNNEDIEQNLLDYLESVNAFDVYRYLYFDILKPLSVLDPAVGSGAFLFAALNILLPIYRKTIDKLKTFSKQKGKDRELLTFLDTLSKHSEEYFITKQIILNNLYGVDIIEEATEICKLRLFLQLASHLPDINEIEPLPDIDFNIYAGNSLVGGLSWEDLHQTYSMKLFDKNGQKIDEAEIKRKIDVLKKYKREYNNYQQTDLNENGLRSLKENVNILEAKVNQSIDIGVSNPMHWFIEFFDIIKQGGFDVIIGNPPYVEYKNIKDYKIFGYKTLNCGDLYGFFIERAIKVSHQNSRISFIVPISLVSTDGFGSVRNLLTDCVGTNWFSSYAMRPGKLFEGAEKHLSIWIGRKFFDESSSVVFTSKYHRWKSEERNKLFKSIRYIKLSKEENYLNSLPKISLQVEKNILHKIFKNKSIAYNFSNNSKYIVYHTRKLRYFVQFLDVPPLIITADGEHTFTSELKEVRFGDELSRDVALAAYCSSLFFYYFITLSDCRNLNKREVANFPLNIADFSEKNKIKLSQLSKKLMQNLQSNSIMKKLKYKKYGEMTIQMFSPRLSKPIIDKIDEILGEHYNFNKQEREFIINYDIKYRLGDVEE